LGKGIIIEPLEKLDTDYIARRFVKCFIGQHGIPAAITSDRGNQFVNELWARICELLGIRRRLSTAYHPLQRLMARRNGPIQQLKPTSACFAIGRRVTGPSYAQWHS
jgi:hypothetical protein